MELSVIIVNFNVKYFIEQCLLSCKKALSGIEGEIIIIDNNSVDGSVSMIKEKFSELMLIENSQNFGFSKSVNQGIKKASGKFILLLNPDTVVEENTFRKSIEFMETHPETGALGVKMIDGKGKFLPESKRSMPTPSVAFYKIFGFSKLFPRSNTFARYNLGFLSPDKINEVEILPGAYMLIRKKVLDQVGLLDEDFFMYGEDIDLSYRILQQGYKNYYYPETTIIHYKGESTKKGSLNYVLMFYNAMLIFANKHFTKRKSRLFSFMIWIAIYFRAALSVIRRIVEKSFLPLLDIILIYSGYLLLTPLWESIKLTKGTNYPPEFLHFVVPAYVVIWVLSNYINGAYDKPYRLLRVFTGIIIGTILILIIYALLPLQLRFSRALIFLGATWAILSTSLIRILLNYINAKYFKLYKRAGKKILIVGKEEENEKVSNLILKSNVKPNSVSFVAAPGSKMNSSFIGKFDQLDEIIKINKIDEIIFCAKDIEANEIITKMIELSDCQVEFKIAPTSNFSVIGSNSTYSIDNPYLIEVNAISLPRNKRIKRLFDIVTSVIFLVAYPLFFLIIKHPLGFFRNIVKVLGGTRTWVGYSIRKSETSKISPSQKAGILTPGDGYNSSDNGFEGLPEIYLNYANNYRISNDILIILKNFKFLGREES